MAATQQQVKKDVDSWEIVQALLNDAQFDFKDRGPYLREGHCPSCEKKELFIKKDAPWVVMCNRLNNCGYRESTRDLYPELFNQYTERHPPTEANPKATADAYMQHNRRFPLDIVRPWYDQERYRIPGTDEVAETVRFYINEARTIYWERLIDKAKGNGQRINFGGHRKADDTLVKGDWWMPPGQTLEAGDTVYLVEGIFHAIALHLSGYKACATLMAGNFPSLSIKPHLEKGIQWRLALDDDKAGREYMDRHQKKLLKLGERVRVLLTGTDKDWDDLYRLDQLKDDFLQAAYWRGRMWSAQSIAEKGWAYYAWRSRRTAVLDFNNRLWSIKVDDKLSKELAEAGYKIEDEDAREYFNQYSEINTISNCYPRFIYCENVALTGELYYLFSVKFNNGNPPKLVRIPGGGIESPAAFNKALLSHAGSATFDGNSIHMRNLRERWFRKKTLHVETIPFLGYHKESGCYLFKDFAFYKGRELLPNEHGFYYAGSKPVKTNFGSFEIARVDKDSTEWFPNFMKVFDQQGLALLAFFFGSLFAEQVRFKRKFYPFFEISGEHGTGKSTILEFLWKLAGRDDYEGFDPSKSSKAGRARNFSQTANLPVVLIESDRGEGGAKQKMFDFEELKTAFNGRPIRTLGVYNRGTDTEEPPFRSSFIFAQNAPVDGTKALLSRIIQAEFTKDHFTPETEKLALFFETAEVGEVGGFLRKALRAEERILMTIFKHYPRHLKASESWEGVADHRIRKTHSLLLAVADALKLVIKELNDDTLQRFKLYVQKLALQRQQALSADHPICAGFWETYDLLNVVQVKDPDAPYSQKAVEVEQLNHSSDPGMIAISLKQFNQLCMENKMEMTPTIELKKYLPASRKHRFIGQKSVRSKIIHNKTIWCWCFAAKELS